MTICHGSPWCRNVADDHCPFSIRGWWLFFYPLSYLTLTIKNLLQILYWLCSVGVFAVLGLNKVASIKVILASIIPALIILALVITVIELIDVIFEKSSEKMSCVELDNKIMMDVLNERGLKAKLADLISAQEQNVFSRFNIGTADKIIQLNDKCELIWILTDLSHDIAFTDFNSWLEKQLNMYDQLKCNILHTLQTPAKGLIRTAESFQRKFRDRIYRGEIKNYTEHYIWSETYGMIFVQFKDEPKGNLYISLGTT